MPRNDAAARGVDLLSRRKIRAYEKENIPDETQVDDLCGSHRAFDGRRRSQPLAASSRDPGQDQNENQVTAQLNQQQVGGSTSGYAGGGYGIETYQGIMQSRGPNQTDTREQIAQPPDAGDLSVIE